MSLKASLVLAPLVFAIACASDPGVGPGVDDPNNPDPTTPDVNLLQGSYDVTSKYDLSQSPDLPGFVTDALGPLTSISDNPAGALIELLDANGAGLGELLDQLGPLRSVLEAQINDYIQDKLLEGNTAGDITAYVDMLATMLTNFEVVTDLSVGNADEAGNANGTHTLKAVAFQQDNMRVVIQSPDILNVLSEARDVSLNADFSSSSIAVGDHAFQLPLGDFAVTAFHAALETRFGVTDLGAKLNEMIDCAGLATQIGDIEIFGFTAVTEEQVGEFCVDGLNKLPEELDKQIRKLEFAELRMVGGIGTLKATSRVDSFEGDWDSEFGVNGSGFAIPSTFTAVRTD
jgi:hypothetical protein